MANKGALTPVERVKAAYLRLVRGTEINDLAVAYEVNPGRVTEAITAIKLAADDPIGVRAAVEGSARSDVEADEEPL
jgi:ParB-like chromosome segregation protein Spo0J